MPKPVIAPDGRMPGSTILDRFHDWQDAMEDGTCTRECGAARNDICMCRCKGLHHNAAHDYWATQPREVITVLPGGSTIKSLPALTISFTFANYLATDAFTAANLPALPPRPLHDHAW